VVGVYIPPRRNRTEVKRRLDLIKGCIDRHPSWPALVAGDFNAHSTRWGNPATDSAGIAVEEWAASLGLVLLNRGSVSTCVRGSPSSTLHGGLPRSRDRSSHGK